MRPCPALIVSAAFTVNAALAFPDGAPWGAANPAAEQHCASCHFGAEPIHDSSALIIDGLPARPVAGANYVLAIVFDDPQIVTAGFQLLAHAAGSDAGTFSSEEDNVEFVGSAIRSTAPAKSENGVSWNVEWRAPGELSLPIVFYIGASAANDDGSPFGDTIHYRSYRIESDSPSQ